MMDSPTGETALEPLDDDRWRCPTTELITVSTPKSPLWRVFNQRYRSPLNPPPRTGPETDCWNRFDLADHATLYGASAPRGAYLEALAYAQEPIGRIPFAELFPDVGADEDPVADEWRRLSHLPPRQVPATWRTNRRLAELVLTNDDYYVDLSAAETIGALRRSAHAWAPPVSVADSSGVDLARLAGSDRLLTCAAAKWLAGQVLANGLPPRGVRYPSKHGADLWCWAVWIPLSSDGTVEEMVAKYAWTAQETPISRDRNLQWAAHQLGICVW